MAYTLFDSFKKRLINMCWTTKEKWRTRPRLAKKRIEVWKIYESIDADNLNLRSCIYYFRISKHMRYQILETVMDYPVWKPYLIACIDKGFHSYKKGTIKIERIIKPALVVEGKIKVDIKAANFHRIVVRCYIPIGAIYYLSESGEYVSDKIVVEDVIDYDELEKLD